MLLVHCWGDLDMPLVHVWGWSSLLGVVLTCRLFTFGLYLDMPFVHFWGGLGMPLVHLAQQGDDFSRVGFVLLCCLFTFGGDLDTLLVHFWGWSSVFQCMVGVLTCCRLALQGQLGCQARVHLLASLLAVSFVQLPFTLMRLTLMV